MNNNKKHPGMVQVAARPEQIEQVKAKLIEQQFDGAHEQRLKAEMFPTDLDQNWYWMAKKALRFESPLSIGVSADEFRELVNICLNQKLPTMYQFAILSNVMESKSEDQLQCSTDAYLETIDQIWKMAEIWRIKNLNLRDEVIDEIGTNLKLKEAEPEKPLGSFGVVKGEA